MSSNASLGINRYVLCIDVDGYPVSLELHKVYRVIPDAEGDKHGQVRLVDESGEDYLFPESLFVEISLPPRAEQSFQVAR